MIHRISDAVKFIRTGNTELAEGVVLGVGERRISVDKQEFARIVQHYLTDKSFPHEYWTKLAKEYEENYSRLINHAQVAFRCLAMSYMYSAVLALEEAEKHA